MGESISKLTRPLKNINVKNRAFRLISKEKPKRAPHHPTTVKYLEKMLMQASPPITKEVSRIHLERLKHIYVTAERSEVQVANNKNVKLKLPHNRKTITDSAFGYLEPRRVPQGKLTLRQALSFIARYHSEPKKWTISFISQHYRLRKAETQNILHYFRPFQTYVSDEEGEEWHTNVKTLRRMTAGKPKLLALKNK